MAVYPAWATGDIFSASFLRDSAPQIIMTTTAQSLDALDLSGALDKELFFYAQAGAQYLVETYLLFNLVTTDVAIFVQWHLPTGVTALMQNLGPTVTQANMVSRTDTRVSLQAGPGASAHALNNDGLDTAVWGHAIFTMGAAPGNITLVWKPQTGVTGTITRDVGSVMVVTRFA